MKKHLLTLIFFLSLFSFSKAQYAFIPDTNFRNFLMTNGFAGCMQGDSLDTTCTAVVNATKINCYNKNIHDLTGLKYFDNLDTLDMGKNPLNIWPLLSDSLIYLACDELNFVSIPSFPSALKEIHCAGSIQLTSLPSIPSGLEVLSCFNNVLTFLPPLPNTLKYLSCSENLLTALPNLPSTLRQLYCNGNQLTSLPTLPNNLYDFTCGYNQLFLLPNLPTSLYSLGCYHNNLISLPSIPLACHGINCEYNLLTSLPTLPNSLVSLYCDNNNLTSLPSIPNLLLTIDCSYNQISSLPELLDSMFWLHIEHNPLSCLPEIKVINYLTWDSTLVICLPNIGRVYNSNPLIDTLPLCDPFSLCPLFWNISGKVFFDSDSSCTQDTTEISLKDIPVVLDSGGTQLQQMLADNYGRFSFQTGYGNYNLRVDTTNLPYHVVCPVTFFRTSTLNAVDTLLTDVDFGLTCNSGFDLAARSASPLTMLTVGHQRTLFLNAGDAASFYGAHCAVGISGSVEAIIQGLVTYISPAAGALTPTSINGDTVTWSISDFSLIDPVHDFNIIVEVSTSATINDSVCVQLNVLPTAGDNIPSNNSLSECFPIRNAVDPNEKYMSPSGLVDTSQQWFTFTIFFQNTGNAPAEDIYVLDTLDQNLDATTFTYLSSSHDVITQLLPGNILRFNYPNIYLADSTTNEPASHGYVQFKIKRKENLPINTTISNTAYIYFDFNAAVATNRVEATFVSIVGVSTREITDFKIYPNPVNAKLEIRNLKLEAATKISIYNMIGVKVLDVDCRLLTVDCGLLPSGMYFLKVTTATGSSVKKFVKQ